MTRKAQVEFMAVIGIVALILVIAYYTYSTGTLFSQPVPQGVAQEQKLVIDTITTQGIAGADLAVKWVERQGGFITPDLSNSVLFNMMAVPYWEKCSDTSMKPSIIDIRNRIERAVKNYINNSLYYKTDWFGRNVSLDLSKMTVRANILDEKIDFMVNLTGTVNGYSLQGPMTFSMPTRLGRIYQFASDFVAENRAKRALEYFTITSIYFSSEVATQGALTQCGDSIYQSGYETKTGLEHAIKYTLANTLWWTTMPAASDKSKTYSFDTVNGRRYPNLDIGFYLPDGFALSPAGSLSVSNDKYVAQAFIFTITECIAIYNWKYSVGYPVVVSVKDQLTGDRFNFAVYVYVNDMKPGVCSGSSTPTGGGAAEPGPCDNLGCYSRFRVVDTAGLPLTGATASFAGCPVGASNSDGYIEGPTACGSYQLSVARNGYDAYTTANMSNINNTYTLYKMINLTMNLSFVDINSVDESAGAPRPYSYWNDPLEYNRCSVSPVTGSVTTNLSSDRGGVNIIPNIDRAASHPTDCTANPSCVTCFAGDVTDSSACSACSACMSSGFVYRSQFSTDSVSGGTYAVNVHAVDMGLTKPKGAFYVPAYAIPETDTKLNLYVPVNESGVNFIDIPPRVVLADKLRNKCSIEPVASGTSYYGSSVTMSGCSCGQLREMAARELGSCITASKLGELFWPSNTTGWANPNTVTWSCDMNSVRGNVTACGYALRGC
jgi:hypothetical protein